MRRLLLIAVILLSACGQPGPKPECDPGGGAGFLDCDRAVRVALDALPKNHPTITRIQYVHGAVSSAHRRPPELGEQPPVYSAVIFTWADGARRQYVELTLFRGKLTVAKPAPY